jgi:PTEN induced putative kinase 1
MPLLPDAMQLYPAAIPPQTPADIRLPGMGENSQPLHTMFLVMKRYVKASTCMDYIFNGRYSMTLREYVLLHDNTLSENMHKRTVLVAQLFEAIAFLYEQRVAHRDLKSDNILLQLDEVGKVTELLLSQAYAPIRRNATFARDRLWMLPGASTQYIRYESVLYG